MTQVLIQAPLPRVALRERSLAAYPNAAAAAAAADDDGGDDGLKATSRATTHTVAGIVFSRKLMRGLARERERDLRAGLATRRRHLDAAPGSSSRLLQTISSSINHRCSTLPMASLSGSHCQSQS